jgi:glyoxylase-like metal-dependent hydrolase (beta-lactamase superfamily II)
MTRTFASAGDMTEKTISFDEIGPGLYAFTAEGDPNTGVIIGDDSVMIVEAQATPRLARKVIDCVRSVTDKPISHLVLTHYHAVRVLGASAYGAGQIIMSDAARAMVAERGQEDWDSEFARFPRLFEGHEEIPGLTWPTTTFSEAMTVYLGNRRIDIFCPGRAHTAGDAVVWVPDAEVMFTGDIVEYHSACYCGDGHLQDWGGHARCDRGCRPAGHRARPWRRADRARHGRRRHREHAGFRGLHLCPGRPRRGTGRQPEGRLGRGARSLRSEIRRLRDLRALPALQRRPRL